MVLAERAGKLHAQAGHGVLGTRARRALGEATREFDAALRIARRDAASADAIERVLLLGLLWQDYRPWLAKPATREAARGLSERTEELSWMARKVAQSGGPANAGFGAECAAAAAMAQRAARLQLLRRWDVTGGATPGEIAAAMESLRASLDRLAAGTPREGPVGAELAVAENQRVFMAAAVRELEAAPAAGPALEVVAKTADHILESLQRAARLEREARGALSPSG